MRLGRLARECSGTSMVEFSIIAFLFFVLTGGVVELAFAFYQWNSASKSLQLGARLASISDPVDSGLKGLDGLGGGRLPGDPFPAFKSVCTSAGCVCTGPTSCTYSSAALNTIVYGRGQTSCGTVGADQTLAMCDIFGRVQPSNVRIIYEQTGLGFAGRPGGPVPTITMELTGLTFKFVFLEALLGFAPIAMPPMRTTATAEDMSTNWTAN